MARKMHLVWGDLVRCYLKTAAKNARRTAVVEDVTCGSCLRLIELDRIHDFEWAAQVGSAEVARVKRWAAALAKANAGRA